MHILNCNCWPDFLKDLVLLNRCRFVGATLFWAGGEYNRVFGNVNSFCITFFKKAQNDRFFPLWPQCDTLAVTQKSGKRCYYGNF